MGLPVVVGVASLLLLAGCSKEQNNTSPINSDRRIEFRSADAPATKGTEITEVADGTAFGVSAWYATTDGSYYEGYTPAFYNTAVTRSGDTYYYDNPVYWPVDQNICIRFFGWYPYDAGTISEQTVAPPQLSFQVAQNVPDQVDLLYGVTDPLNNYANQDPVKFNFNHALTRVRFAVRFADDMPNGYKVDIKELYISGCDKGTLTLPATPNDDPMWALDETSWNYYDLRSGLTNVPVTKTAENQAVRITADGYETLSPAGKEMKICAFLWTYYGYPNSNYQGINVEVMRYRNGEIMARDEISRGALPKVDYVAGVPDSGLPHAIGFANRSGKPFARPFVKYTPTWPRSFMPANQEVRNQVAKMKQIPVPELIEGKKLLFVDDSIVRGTQLRETVEFLYESGAEEVHMRSACPPIMYSCKYLNFSRGNSDMDLLARRTVQELEGDEGQQHLEEYADGTSERGQCMLKTICEKFGFTSLGYQSLDGLLEAIGLDRDKVCTYCWNGKE